MTKKDLLSNEVDIDTFIKESKVFMKNSEITGSVGYSSCAAVTKQRNFERVLNCTNSNGVEKPASQDQMVSFNTYNSDNGGKANVTRNISILNDESITPKPCVAKRGFSSKPPQKQTQLDGKKVNLTKDEAKINEVSRECTVSLSASKLSKNEKVAIKKNSILQECNNVINKASKAQKPPAPPHLKKENKVHTRDVASSDTKVMNKESGHINKMDDKQGIKPVMLSFNMCNNPTASAPPRILQSHTIKKAPKKEKTKEELAEYRKKIMKSHRHTYKPQIAVCNSDQKPKGPTVLLERLAMGKKAKRGVLTKRGAFSIRSQNQL
jgi:hypothetical protein